MNKYKSKLINFLVLLLFVLLLLYLLLNENGIIKYLKLRGEITELDNKIYQAEKTLYDLQKEIDSLKYSLRTIEKVAREKYHMHKPYEQEILIEEDEK
ncbi:FtsB family cell division protein [Melioribacter sp. OK-6-Me]|uniref:FtsB family cell division protein n=1 Tax=unclassified Melioribacter TaxID=2627329 RepID=UPI003ED993B7